MAINIPIISEFDGKGISKAIAEFKKLETNSEKAQFAIKKAAVPAAAALAGLGAILFSSAKGAEAARQANQKLGNVLDSMGYKKATDRVINYAESLEKTLANDAEVIKATQTKLATFGELTKSVDEAGGAFDRATLAAIDLAAAGFGSAESNAVALGKALNDPIKGITALAKSGVTFTEVEKEKIKALTESGKLLEAQDIVLAAIEKQVGGTAEASASSFDKMKFAFAGVADTVGEMVLPAMDALAPLLAGISAWAQENPELMKIAILAIGGLATAIISVNAAMKIFTAVQTAATAAQTLFNAAAAANPYILIAGAVVAATAAIVLFRKQIAQSVKDFDEFFERFGIFGKIAGAAGKLSIPGLGAIGSIGSLLSKIPGLADGGIVRGPTLAMIGEAGPEAVVPLDRMGSMGGGVTINVHGGDPESVVDALRRYMRMNGSVPIRIGNAF